MTIRPGEEWGHEVARPDGLVVLPGDAELAAAIATGDDRPLAVSGGDLFRTIGARPVDDRPTLRALPIDMMTVVLDDGEPTLAVAHVALRSPARRGAWWRGPVTLVMNAEFLGNWDVAVRGHPNDGRVERFDLAAGTGIRQRRAIASRLRTGSHLPHPAISRSTGRSHLIEVDRPAEVHIDGRRRGRATRVAITVGADAATLFA